MQTETPNHEPATGWTVVQGWRPLHRDADGEYSTAPERVAAPAHEARADRIQRALDRANARAVAHLCAAGWL